MIFWGNEKTGKSPYRKSPVTGSKEKRVYQKAYFSAMCHRGHRSETDWPQRVVPFQPMWLPGKVSWGPPTIRVAWGRKEEVGMPQHLWKQSTKPVGFHILSCGPLDVLQKQPNPQKSTSLWVWEATWVSLPNSPTHHYGTLLNRKHIWSSFKGRPFNHP